MTNRGEHAFTGSLPAPCLIATVPAPGLSPGPVPNEMLDSSGPAIVRGRLERPRPYFHDFHAVPW
jgi:hypothetical protein